MFLVNSRAFGSSAIRAFAFAGCTGLLAGLAAGEAVLTGDHLGRTEAEIAKTLESMGYEVEEFEVKGDHTEVEANIDGVSYEIHVDPATGKILSIEIDD